MATEEGHEMYDVSPARSVSYTRILRALRNAHARGEDGLTRRELEAPTSMRPNQITARVAELKERGAVYVCGTRTCRVSGEEGVEIIAVPAWRGRGDQQMLEAFVEE